MTITDIQILKKLLVKEGAQIHVSLDLGLENLKEGKDIQVFVDFESSDFIISKGFLKHSAFDSKKFEYIQNPDGSMRWFWPDFIEKPYFLKFYSAMGFKSRLFAKLMAILFYVPLVRNFFIKSFYFTSKENLSIGSILDTPNSPYAVFTGTAGPNRKIVVYQSNMEDTYFLKIPFGQNSSAALLNEFEKASYFRPYQKLIATPSITMSQGILRSPDMKIPTVRVDEFTEMAQKKINILVNLTRVDGFSPRFENVLEDKPSSRLMKEFYLR